MDRSTGYDFSKDVQDVMTKYGKDVDTIPHGAERPMILPFLQAARRARAKANEEPGKEPLLRTYVFRERFNRLTSREWNW